MTNQLPPPIPGTAFLPAADDRRRSVAPTLPLGAVVGAIVVLTTSLVTSKYLLDAVVGFGWPLAVYVALLALVGYGPSVWWCRYASARWATGDLGVDIGLSPRWSDLGWGPVVWLAALGAQLAAAAVVVGLGIPISGNTDAIDQASVDRTYVVAIVITAVIAAPIVEEMVFRGVVLRGLRSRLPAVIAVIAQGVLFGAAHVDPVRGAGNAGLVIVLSGVGITFGAASHLLGRLGPSIVAHALFNGAVLLIVLTGVADRLQDAGSTVVQVGVVDQPHVTESSRDGDPTPAGEALGVVQVVDRFERGGIEHVHVVE